MDERRVTRIPERMRESAGFSLIEMLIVMVMLAIFMTIPLGVYLHMRDRGEISAAELNVREALPASALYYAKNETYGGMTRAELEDIANGILLSGEPVVSSDGSRFCIESTHNGRSPTSLTNPGHHVHSYTGPGGGDIVSGACPSSL